MDQPLEQFEYERHNRLSMGRWKEADTTWAVTCIKRYYDDVQLVRRKLQRTIGINTPWWDIRIKQPGGAS